MAPSPPQDATQIVEPGATEAAAPPPGALSALLERLADVPATPLEEGWGRLPPAGTRFGRFELLREVGRGGFGVVFEARDLELPRSVAFKLVRPGHLRKAEDQLKREGEAIAQLSHPNLVTLFDVGRCDFGPFLILELLHGETLEQRLRRGPLAPQDAVALAIEVARGMGHAHARGVVHRDLKPSNVFLCEGGQVKLLDFGMSHAFGRQRISGGTPAYMAPEQWRGEPEDQRTDVYALGVLLFQALTGRLPFADDRNGEAALSPVPAPRVTVPDAPGLSTLVRRMLEKAPEHRPEGAAEVLLALEQARKPPAHAKVRRRPWERRWVQALAAAAAAGLVLAAVLLLRRPARPPGPPARAIAVLPFHNLSGGADADYFSDGLTEEILHLLTRVRELHVAAGSTTQGPKEGRLAAPELARRLGVDVLLEGSVRRDKEKLRVSAELVDGRTGFRLWSQIYDRRLADVFAIQEDIARQVVGALELVLSGAAARELDRPAPASLAAYDLYLRGRAALRQPASAATLEEAVRLFEAAIAADGQFAVAHAGLCDAWLARYDFSRASAAYARAEQACQQALEKEPQAAAVHEALGRLHLTAGDAPRAERELAEAVALSTNPVGPLLALARAQEAQGRADQALQTCQRARQLDPNDWHVSFALGQLHFKAGRHDEAVAAFAEVVQRNPESPGAHANLGAARLLAGDLEGAAEALGRSVELGPNQGALSNLGLAAFYRGRFEEAAGRFKKAVELAPDDHELWGNLADALHELPARAAEAVEAYRRAVELAGRQLAINREDDYTRATLARYEVRLGDAARARRTIEEALRRGAGDLYVQYNAALVRLELGDRDAALAALERSVALGYPRRLLPHDVALAPLRGQPRFDALAAPPPKPLTPPPSPPKTGASP